MSPTIFWSFIAISAWGVAPILEKLGLMKMSPSLIMFIQSFVIACILGISCFLNKTNKMQLENGLEWSTLAVVIGAAIAGGLIGEYAYFRAIADPDTGKAVALTSAYPLVTVVCSMFILGESATLMTALGSFLIICGVAVLSSGGSI